MNGVVFFAKYLIWFGLLYGLLFVQSFSPLFLIQEWQTDITIWLTNSWIHYFEIGVKMLGNTIYLPSGFKIWIEHSCNGLLAYLLFAVAILAYPTYAHLKLIWLLEGYLYLLIVNSIRIDFVVYVSIFDHNYFTFIHDFIGRGFIFINLVVMFMLFTLRVKITKGIKQYIERRRGLKDRRHARAHQWRASEYENRNGLVDRRGSLK